MGNLNNGLSKIELQRVQELNSIVTEWENVYIPKILGKLKPIQSPYDKEKAKPILQDLIVEIKDKIISGYLIFTQFSEMFLFSKRPVQILKEISNSSFREFFGIVYAVLYDQLPNIFQTDIFKEMGPPFNKNLEEFRSSFEELKNLVQKLFTSPFDDEFRKDEPQWFGEIIDKYNDYLLLAFQRDPNRTVSFIEKENKLLKNKINFTKEIARNLTQSTTMLGEIVKKIKLQKYVPQGVLSLILGIKGIHNEKNSLIPQLKATASSVEGIIKPIYNIIYGLEHIILHKSSLPQKIETIGWFSRQLDLKLDAELSSLRNCTEHMDFEIQENEGTSSIFWKHSRKLFIFTLQDLKKIENAINECSWLIRIINIRFLLKNIQSKEQKAKIQTDFHNFIETKITPYLLTTLEELSSTEPANFNIS